MKRLWCTIALCGLALLVACRQPPPGTGPDGGSADGGSADPGPTFAPLPDVSLFAGQTRTVTAKATDPDGDALTYALATGLPAWITLDGDTVSFAPPNGTSFAGTVEISASDPHGRTASATLAVAVSPGRITGTVGIDGGAAFTGSADVTLTLTGHSTGGAIATMAFSNDGTTFSSPEPFAATKTWTLDATSDGTRTVTVRLTDANGATATVAGTITLDQTPPADGTVTIDGGASTTSSNQVTLGLSDTDATSGVGKVCIESATDPTTLTAPAAGDPCFDTSYAATVPYTLHVDAVGTQTVKVWFEDVAGNLNPNPATATIRLDHLPPPTGVSLVSVQYHTVVIAYTPVPSSGAISYEVGYRLAGTSDPFAYAPATSLSASQLEVELSAAHTYDLVVRAVDAAGDASSDVGPFTATTYFPWTHENRLPTGLESVGLTAVAVLGGDHFVTGAPYQGEAWIDGADGFATFHRLDAGARTIVPVGTTPRALFISGKGAKFTADLGTTFWPVTFSPAPTLSFYGGALLGTTTSGQATTDRFVVVGSGRVYVGSVLTRPGHAPLGTLTAVTPVSNNALHDGAVARCDACAGDVLVAAYGGGLWRSPDGGQTWTAASGQAGDAERVVALPGTKTLFASSTNLLVSTDGGQTWASVPGVQAPFGSDLALAGSGTHYTLWGAGDYAFNGGYDLARWDGTTESSIDLSGIGPIPLFSREVAVKGQGPNAEAVTVGEDGQVLDVAQDGAVITQRDSGDASNGVIAALSFEPGNPEIAAFLDRTHDAYLTTDHGQTWTPEDTGAAGSLLAIHLFTDGSAVAVGVGGVVVARSTTGQWHSVSSGYANPLQNIACAPTAGCLLEGQEGALLHYDPATTTVTPLLPEVLGTEYQDLTLWTDAGGAVHGAEVGDRNTFRTCTGCTTAGTFSAPTQLPATITAGVAHLDSVASRSDGHLVAVGSTSLGSHIFSSSDGGTTWQRRYPEIFSTHTRVAHVSGTSTWFIAGYGAPFDDAGQRTVVRSDDDGATWHEVPVYTVLDAQALAVAPNPTGGISVLVGGDHGQLLYSGTGGL